MKTLSFGAAVGLLVFAPALAFADPPKPGKKCSVSEGPTTGLVDSAAALAVVLGASAARRARGGRPRRPSP